jgi:putative ABC transport system permease protein
MEQARRDVDDEVAFHLEMRTEELIAQGRSRAEALAQAEREFGDLDRARARLQAAAVAREREELRTMYLDELRQDLRYGWRVLRERKGFSAVAILTLALGVAATTTVYTVFDAVVARPLPITEPDRVVVPHALLRTTQERWSVTYADFVDWRDRGFFEHVAVFQQSSVDLRIGQEPERFQVAVITDGFFPALGARAQLGRLLGPDDFKPAAPRALVISHEVWQSRFGGAPDVVGRTVGARRPGTIVGVLERGAEWPTTAQVWAPIILTEGPPSSWMERDNYMFAGIARLHPGATLERTIAQMDALARTIELDNPRERANIGLTAIPLQEEMLGEELPRALVILLAAVAIVLLIGCANIANLLLVRGSGRRREFAVRTAIGARPFRLARQLLTESLVLGVIGGALGVLLARWGVQLVVQFAPSDMPRLNEISLNPKVLFTGLGASIGAAILFGFAPMLQASRVATASTLADASGRSVGSRSGERVRRTLVVAELTLSVMLLVGAGLLVRSLIRLQQVNPGFQPEQLVTFALNLVGPRYEDAGARANFYDQLTQRLRVLPGASDASITSALPLGGGGFYLGRAFLAQGQPEPPAGPEVSGQWNVVGPGFFKAMGVQLSRGRDFTAQDDSATTPVMIVNQRFAELMFPGQDPIGKRVRSWRDENLLREIVGVVANVRYFGAGDEVRGLVYVPHTQNTWSGMSVVVRTSSEPNQLLPLVRREVAALEPNVAVANLSTMRTAYSDSIARPRFGALLLAIFAGLALVLASIGIYGVLSYGVSQRTREIGVRMALGAKATDVVRLVLNEALMLVGAGIGLGLIAAFAVSKSMTSLLFDLDARDPLTFGVVALLLTVIALLASYVPARRATGVQPITALRQE